MELKLLLRRGALLAAANWPVVAIQFAAETTFRAVPILGAANLVALLLGGTNVLQGNLRDTISAIVATLMAEPFAVTAFVTALGVVLVGGSILLFLIKGGTVDVLIAADEAAGSIEREPITAAGLRRAARFTLHRFSTGCTRLFRRYVVLGFVLMIVYAASVGAYLAIVVYGYRAVTSRLLVFSWTLAFAAWIMIVQQLYLLMQIAMAVDNIGPSDGWRAVSRFIRAECRDLARVFAVAIAMVVVATLASALAFSGFGLIAFIPLVGLAVFPLQLLALLFRELVFQYLGMVALSAYVTLYKGHALRRIGDAQRPRVARPFERPA